MAEQSSLLWLLPSGMLVVAVLVVAWAWPKALREDAEQSREWTESDELAADDELATAIREWRESLVPFTPEQRERSWQNIVSRLPKYPRKSFRVVSPRGTEP